MVDYYELFTLMEQVSFLFVFIYISDVGYTLNHIYLYTPE